jgi:hypothetical protein
MVFEKIPFLIKRHEETGAEAEEQGIIFREEETD